MRARTWSILILFVAVLLLFTSGATGAPYEPEVEMVEAVVPTATPEPVVMPPIETPEPTPEQTPEPEIVIDENEATLIAKTLWGECRGCSLTEQAAVVWCILNRVDADGHAMGNSVEHVVTFPNQFLGYNENHPVTDELYALAVDVLTRWQLEKLGEEDVGRVLPADYMWFHGDGQHNHFRNKYQNGTRWDWSLPSPYET